ncbi:MAG TPA: hypothetical protein VFE03_10945, partial [Caulobacteraceae bacterium]|nr:hypothetical protein [Caulobacteraceae bacterium]
MAQAPIAEDLFEVVAGVPHLIGGRRKDDGKVVFPRPAGPEGAHFESLRLAHEGRLWSYTV